MRLVLLISFLLPLLLLPRPSVQLASTPLPSSSPTLPPPTSPPPTAAPHPDHPVPDQPLATPDEHVFIPLKEWKARKLSDLESRARRLSTPPTSPPPIPTLPHICLPRTPLIFLRRTQTILCHTPRRNRLRALSPSSSNRPSATTASTTTIPLLPPTLALPAPLLHPATLNLTLSEQVPLPSPMAALMALPMVAGLVRSLTESALAASPHPLPAQRQPTNRSNTTVSTPHVMPRVSSPPRPPSSSPPPSPSLEPPHTPTTEPRMHEKPFNFASADAGARILASAPGVVGAKNVIESSVDKYSLAPCEGAGPGGSRWIDLELSEDVIVESIEAANFEYYSSSPRRLAVLGASSYPPPTWNVLGVFDFADVRSLQRFTIKKRTVTRFMRVLFAGKQGNEYYCPISSVRAFGKNLIADWKDLFDSPAVVDANDIVRKPSTLQTAATSERKGSMQNLAVHTLPDGNKAGSASQRDPSEARNEGRKSSKVTGQDQSNSEDGSNVQNHVDAAVANLQQSQGEYPAPANSPRSLDSSTEPSDSVAHRKDRSSPEPSSSEGEDEGTLDKSLSKTIATEENDEDGHGEAMSEEDKIVLEAVRADALSAGSGDDNIFRKVTRMIRLLELNQTLTNQYIDTHLARFAKALSSVQVESVKSQESAATAEKRTELVISLMESTIQEMRSAALRRDMVLCVLVICLIFLLGTHWVLWAAVSGGRMHGPVASNSDWVLFDSFRSRQSLESASECADHILTPAQEMNMQKRARRKTIGDVSPLAQEAASNTSTVMAAAMRSRSVSSMELSAVSRRESQDYRSESVETRLPTLFSDLESPG